MLFSEAYLSNTLFIMVGQTATMEIRPSPSASDNRNGNDVSGLDVLQSSQRRKVLDMVDELRKCGLDNDISLPQIVVCGDQSAGMIHLPLTTSHYDEKY